MRQLETLSAILVISALALGSATAAEPASTDCATGSLPSALCSQAESRNETDDCLIGAYRLKDDTIVDINSADGAALRWRHSDGTTGALTKSADNLWKSTLGWTGRADGRNISFSACSQGTLRFDGVEGRRLAFDSTDTAFDGEGVKLAGRLILPKGQTAIPVVVLLHGSESDSSLLFNSMQRRLPAAGIGVFVYDKRGTGKSTGTYTQDFTLLARDAVAAMKEARRLAGYRVGRIGYQGPSQGGWIAPLAAQSAPVDFVIVTFGLAVSPVEEDREAVELNMQKYPPDIQAKALEIASAAEDLIASGMTQGFERLEQVRELYQREPWFKDVRGNFTYLLLGFSPAELREKRQMFVLGTPMHYDSVPVIASLKTPQLWILAQDDIDAPSAETARRLEKLRASGHPITTAMFPRTEHGIFEYETQPDGTRLSTRQPQGYLELMLDFARQGRVHGQYGSATVSAPAKSGAH
ncbi:MAG: alpha/beta hydrolase [Steroidobacteraceae bacterium]